MDRTKWSLVVALACVIAAAVHTFIDQYDAGQAWALVAIAMAVLSLHEK